MSKRLPKARGQLRFRFYAAVQKIEGGCKTLVRRILTKTFKKLEILKSQDRCQNWGLWLWCRGSPVQCPVEPKELFPSLLAPLLHLTCESGAVDDKDLAVSSDQAWKLETRRRGQLSSINHYLQSSRKKTHLLTTSSKASSKSTKNAYFRFPQVWK